MSRIPEKIDSKFRYVLLASNRAEQLVQGAKPKAEGAVAKPTRLAMAEITEDKVEWDYGPAEEPAEEGPAEETGAEEGEAGEA